MLSGGPTLKKYRKKMKCPPGCGSSCGRAHAWRAYDSSLNDQPHKKKKKKKEHIRTLVKGFKSVLYEIE